MPLSQHLYTSYFVQGNAVDPGKLNDKFFSVCWSTRSKTAEQNLGGTIKLMDYKEISKLAENEKVKKIEEITDGGVEVRCRDAAELKDLIDGKVKRLYHTGDWDEHKIRQQIDL